MMIKTAFEILKEYIKIIGRFFDMIYCCVLVYMALFIDWITGGIRMIINSKAVKIVLFII